MNKEEIQKQIADIEQMMQGPDFWQDKQTAQAQIKKLQELKLKLEGGNKYDKGNAIVTIFSGAGGDDAEDFSAMLLRMYSKYIDRKNWSLVYLHQNQNDHGGYRNVTFEVEGRGAFGDLRGENGVHRLVRISPFNTNAKRHTSFSLVEVVPKLDKTDTEIIIAEKDLEISFARSSGPGGQNVNKRETAVRVVHMPTGLSVHVDSERSQEQNREKALELLKGKLYRRQEEERVAAEKGLYISKNTDIEWGNQIRSYVLHPYKMIKDHRTGIETANVEKILEGGEIDEFIKAEKDLDL